MTSLETDVLPPMWVADMDFASPPCVLQVLQERVKHGVFGYAVAMDEVNRAVVAWADSHYGWQIEADWIVWLPGLVPGIHVACMAWRCCGGGGDHVRSRLSTAVFLLGPEGHGTDGQDRS